MEPHEVQWERNDVGKPRPLLVSFSGIDGAGKTTQIEKLAAWLGEAGLRVSVVRFWDDVALLRSVREALGHALFKGEKGVGAPGKPVRRRDKNVQTWYLFPMRVSLYFLDALSLAFVWGQSKRTHDADVVIFDRYLYDQLANLNVSSRSARTCVRLLLRLVPHPDLAYLLDADPVVARARKPEYPLEFLSSNRDAYFEISKIAGMDVIGPGTPEEVELSIRRALTHRLAGIHDWPVPQALTSM